MMRRWNQDSSGKPKKCLTANRHWCKLLDPDYSIYTVRILVPHDSVVRSYA